MDANANGSGALYRDAAIEQAPPQHGRCDTELAVLPPPRLETTADLVEWFDKDLHKWLMALDALIPRGGECADLALNIVFDLVQLFPPFVECLRTGRLESIGVERSPDVRERFHRVAESLAEVGHDVDGEDASVAAWLLKAALARAEAHEREAEHAAPEDGAREAIASGDDRRPGAAHEEASAADVGAGVSVFALDYLDPDLFADLDSVRAFVEGNGIDAMLYALANAGAPLDPVIPPAPHVMAAAREPIHFLADDVLTLLRAYIAGKPVRAERGRAWVECGRDALALVMLRENWVDRLQREILTYLVDPPAAPAAAAEEAA